MQTLVMLSWPDITSDHPFNSGAFNALGAIALQAQAIGSAIIAHPVWAVVLFVLGIGLLQLIADLIKRLIKAFLTFVLTLPLTLSQWVWKRATAPPKAQQAETQQVERLIARLETLRQEQDQVVAELKAVLTSQSTHRVTESEGIREVEELENSPVISPQSPQSP